MSKRMSISEARAYSRENAALHTASTKSAPGPAPHIQSHASTPHSPGTVDEVLCGRLKLRATGKRFSGEHLRASDAKIAAFLQFDDLVATSPNASWVPEFPAVEPEGVWLRGDGRWGPQEYSLWPQLFSKSNVHHSCIPSRPTDPSDELFNSVIWLNIDARVFDAPRKATDPFCCGFLQKDVRLELAKVMEMAVLRILYGHVNDKSPHYELARRLAHQAREALDRLEDAAQHLRDVITSAREVQRITLELMGLKNYLDVFTPLEKQLNYRADKLLPYRGAFTGDLSVVQTLHRVGVPVWYIRSHSAITAGTDVLAVTEHTPWDRTLTSGGFIDCKGNTWVSQKIHVNWGLRSGPYALWTDESLEELFNGLSKFTRLRTMQAEAQVTQPPPQPEPVTAAPPQPESVVATTSVTAPPNKGKRRASTPPTAPNKVAKTATSNDAEVGLGVISTAREFAIPPGLHCERDFPPIPCAWEAAVRSIRFTTLQPKHGATYMLPPPWLMGCSDPTRAARFYHNYIRIREFCHMRAFKKGLNMLSERSLRIADWRDVLFGDYGQTPQIADGLVSETVAKLNKTLPAKPSSTRTNDAVATEAVCGSKKMIRAKRAALRAHIVNEGKLDSYSSEMQPIWRGQAIPFSRIAHDGQLRQEILWDMSERLFRLDLVSLDYKLVQRGIAVVGENAIFARNTMVVRIFGETGPTPLGWLPDVERRLVDIWTTPVSRRVLQAMIDVFRDWPEFPRDLEILDATDMDDPACEALLKQLILFYVNTFVHVFDRLPTVPCHLPESLRS